MIALLYTTFSTKKSAQDIAQQLLEQRLIACVNIFDNMTSMYWWEGKIQKDDEVVMIIKTSKANVNKVSSFIEQHHNYDCPCIIRLSVDGANTPYQNWLLENCKP